MSMTRSDLLGKKVYNPDASAVGEVADIAFSVGANQPTLVVKGMDGGMLELPWDAVSSAKDVILMKAVVDGSKYRRASASMTTPIVQGPAPAQPVAQAQPQVQATMQAQSQGPAPGEKRFCPGCGKPLTWIPQYKRWYCYKEKKYV
jgi:sporulation protein YlmC with PRC-barrel domain